METGIYTSQNVGDGLYIYTEKKQFVLPEYWGIHKNEECALCPVIVQDGVARLVHPNDMSESYEPLLEYDKEQTGKMWRDDCLNDFDGYANTESLADAGSEVAKRVLSLDTFGMKWYIPAAGELQQMYERRMRLIASLLIKGAFPLKESWYCGSTRCGEKSIFLLFWPDGGKFSFHQDSNIRVRPISAFSLSAL